MTVRLENEGRVYGLLSVSIPKQYLSDEEERCILKEIADDIAFGLRNIEIEKDRRRAEEALEASQKRFRTLIENALIGISIIQGDRVIYQNPEQEKLLGPLPRPAKFSDLESIHPEDMDKVRQFHQDITSGRYHALDTDFRFYGPDPHGNQPPVKWVYCRALRINYQDRESLLVNLMDITRIKEMEHMLRMQDKMASLGRVAAGIAHEIRNPLSGINVYLNTLKKTYDKADQLDRIGEIIAQMEGASHKIESVIRRVMDFAKPGEPKTEHIDINQPIDEAVKLSSVTLRKKGIRLEKNLQQGLPICKADPNLIEEVILNLITNAADAMKDMKEIKKLGISTHLEGNYIAIKVSDSGQGVPNHMRNQIFDPFYTTKNGSTGLGLSLAHRIVTDHRGFLRLAKSRWGGAEFIIEIPIEEQG
jgi:PAS domain S-box-containing protein